VGLKKVGISLKKNTTNIQISGTSGNVQSVEKKRLKRRRFGNATQRNNRKSLEGRGPWENGMKIYLVVQYANQDCICFDSPMAAFTSKELAQKLVNDYNENRIPRTVLIKLNLDEYAESVSKGCFPFLVRRDSNNKLSMYDSVNCNGTGVVWAKDEDGARNIFLEREELDRLGELLFL
jgi:hypothetical protein